MQDLCQALYQILLIVLLKEFRKPKCKYGFDDKKCEIFRFKYKNCECCVEYTSFKDDLKEYKCFCCDKSYQKQFDENLKEIFANAYELPNHEINEFVCYCCEKSTFLNTWLIGKENVISLPEKEEFYSHLNMEDMTDADYAYTKIFSKDF